MPFQPGILFSVLLLVLCLGINFTYFPQVRRTFYESQNTIAATSSEQPELSELPPESKNHQTNSSSLASLAQNQKNKENSPQPPAPVIPAKTSKVNKPIQPDLLPKQTKEKEKNSQTFEKKPEILPTESKSDKSKATVKESEKNETKPILPEPKQPEPKKPEQKQPELKQSEPKKPEQKQSVDSVSTVLPLPSSKPVFSVWDEMESTVPSELLPSTPDKIVPQAIVPKTIAPKATESIIPKKSTNNQETAFLPIIPPSLEKEYWQSDGQSDNQLAIYSSRKRFRCWRFQCCDQVSQLLLMPKRIKNLQLFRCRRTNQIRLKKRNQNHQQSFGKQLIQRWNVR
ncbi:MAG: hypothetical protein LBI18_10020 [Planctomycetaceae bacterium]|jgi:hypothetical protein|nr:hypothetical protein [Planctomycetaceae bacterium]